MRICKFNRVLKFLVCVSFVGYVKDDSKLSKSRWSYFDRNNCLFGYDKCFVCFIFVDIHNYVEEVKKVLLHSWNISLSPFNSIVCIRLYFAFVMFERATCSLMISDE